MSLLRLFVQRVVMGLIAAWAVLTAVFALFTATDDWALDRELFPYLHNPEMPDHVIEAAEAEYIADRGLDQPLHMQYLEWMTNMLTLQWGESHLTGEPALGLVVDATIRTAQYVLPAVGLAVTIGVGIGIYAAMNPGSRLGGLGAGSAYLAFAVPSFWIGGLLVSLVVGDRIGYPETAFETVLPILFVTATLVGGYLSYARAHALEYVSADFVSLVRAKGASRVRIARHVVRNAAIPIVSMLFNEVLALLVLSVFVVEMLFGIEGFGLLLFEAVQYRDLPVLLGGTIVLIVVGVVGNIVQDLSYSLLDPRVDTGRR